MAIYSVADPATRFSISTQSGRLHNQLVGCNTKRQHTACATWAQMHDVTAVFKKINISVTHAKFKLKLFAHIPRL